jgi:hypothetical protein
MICGAPLLLWVLLGMILGAPLGILGTLVWASIFTDWTHD